MPAYQLQIKQVVDYPRCRIYRQFVHRLMADRSIRTSGGSGLFYFTVLCSYANFRTSYRRIDGISYSASISGVMSLMPDDIVPTASGKSMKSGYGVKQDVTATLSTDAPTSHITHPQTAFSVFPEFQYETYLRLLQRVSSGRSAKFTFQPNEFSTYNRAVHFSPLWFPDSTDYTVFTQVWDTWTPDGMLSINLNDYVSIDGSLYDDWYTNRE